MTKSIAKTERAKVLRERHEKAFSMINGGPSEFNAGFTLVELMMVMVILAALALLSLPMLRSARDLARQTRAMEEIRGIEKSINAYALEKNSFPNSLSDLNLPGGVPLDPWQHPYVYTNISNGAAPRKDIALNPLNNDFDLYSMGPDGASVLSLTDSTSADDIIRGANGSYVGLASRYIY